MKTRSHNDIAVQLLLGLVGTGGATVNPIDLSEPTTGYAVGVVGAELRTTGTPRPALVEAWLADPATQHVLRENWKYGRDVYVGSWSDNGFSYFDVSVLFADLTKAIEFARDNKQLAVYSFAGKRSIPVGEPIATTERTLQPTNDPVDGPLHLKSCHKHSFTQFKVGRGQC